jgi:hypothetical protein
MPKFTTSLLLAVGSVVAGYLLTHMNFMRRVRFVATCFLLITMWYLRQMQQNQPVTDSQ